MFKLFHTFGFFSSRTKSRWHKMIWDQKYGSIKFYRAGTNGMGFVIFRTNVCYNFNIMCWLQKVERCHFLRSVFPVSDVLFYTFLRKCWSIPNFGSKQCLKVDWSRTIRRREENVYHLSRSLPNWTHVIGLKNVFITFQCIVDIVLFTFNWKFALVCLDPIVRYPQTSCHHTRIT